MADLDKELGAVLANLDAAEDYDDLWGIFVDYTECLGANLISYHHIPPAFGSDKDKITVRAHGFGEEWVKAYASEKLHLIDPIHN